MGQVFAEIITKLALRTTAVVTLKRQVPLPLNCKIIRGTNILRPLHTIYLIENRLESRFIFGSQFDSVDPTQLCLNDEVRGSKSRRTSKLCKLTTSAETSSTTILIV